MLSSLGLVGWFDGLVNVVPVVAVEYLAPILLARLWPTLGAPLV